MRIINIVDSVSPVNYGIWHASIVNASILKTMGFHVELWYPATDFSVPENVAAIPLSSIRKKTLEDLRRTKKLNPLTDIIITHGAWQYPTRWGAWLHAKGHKWIYVPHGMLEPWAMQQKRTKKKIYFSFIEKKLGAKADVIRAVSIPELENLQILFPASAIKFIPNGATIHDEHKGEPSEKKIKARYLFLSRLHHKKNILSLAEAWVASSLNNDPDFELLIGGPDQGELVKLNIFLEKSSNMKYVGSVYGDGKTEILNKSDFYILPSFSEGLPSALLEGMGYGLIPIITEGCNFPDVFIHELGAKITTDKENIKKVLEETAFWDTAQRQDKSKRSKRYIQQHYSIDAITKLQTDLFSEILPRQVVTVEGL